MRLTPWVLVLLLTTTAASAEENRDVARHHFHKGMAAFTLERWDEAVQEFEAGFMAAPDPTFLYNIGQAYRLSNRPTLALMYYQKYLRLAPETVANRAEVEQRMATLQALFKESNRSPQTVVPPAPAPTPSPTGVAAASPVGEARVAAAPAALAVAAAPARRSRLPLVLGLVAGGVIVGGVSVGLGVGLGGGGSAPIACPVGATQGCVAPF